ncbi:type 1 periplasmic-binding domain-containing protein [Streptomyces milbemycinicus]|uniref:Uncharacterized protein n=1 Tax=Streptomyces milbemycinicus TaxID=476552 RepID=A0ABW8LCS1_9ACTN
MVVTTAGTWALPAVAYGCEELGVPCVSSAFPRQAYVYGHGTDPANPFAWTYHFAWGIDDIAAVSAEMWEVLGPAHTVGCPWNDDLQGRLLCHPGYGFLPAAAARDHAMVDPGGYREPAAEAGLRRRLGGAPSRHPRLPVAPPPLPLLPDGTTAARLPEAAVEADPAAAR